MLFSLSVSFNCNMSFVKGLDTQKHYVGTVKLALVTTCIQRPPLFKDHLVMSQ